MLAKALTFFAVGLASILLLQLLVLFFSTLKRLSYARVHKRTETDLFSERLKMARLQLKRQENVGPWSGTRKFQIDRIVTEFDTVCSFYLVPHDKKTLPGFQPGQYLTFELDIPGQRNRVIRCYSLSDKPRKDFYRVTIKRIGLASTYFHSALKVGDIVDVKAPSGSFYLDMNRMTPIVLISAGVGVTPMLSMLNEVVESGLQREVWMFFGVRNRSDHIMKEHLETIARAHSNVRLRIAYSKAEEGDVMGKDYHCEGRVTVDLLKKELPSNNYDYYLCGPGEMMQAMQTGLRDWSVPAANIHMEAFGPASVKKVAPAAAVAVEAIQVIFSRSGREVAWKGQADSLLELGLAENVPLAFGCRAGNCGTCKTAIKSGKVKYLKEPGCEVEAGSCLTCICVPETALALEA
ncbi:MAG: 2Fe-2S iron-sulfur cluster-binding protein [Verrucomicrobiota bacterium]